MHRLPEAWPECHSQREALIQQLPRRLELPVVTHLVECRLQILGERQVTKLQRNRQLIIINTGVSAQFHMRLHSLFPDPLLIADYYGQTAGQTGDQTQGTA